MIGLRPRQVSARKGTKHWKVDSQLLFRERLASDERWLAAIDAVDAVGTPCFKLLLIAFGSLVCIRIVKLCPIQCIEECIPQSAFVK